MKYTKEILQDAVIKSKSVANVLRLLGKPPCSGGTHAHVKRRIKEFGIDTSHFTGQGWRPKGVPIFKPLHWSIILVFNRNDGRKEGSDVLRRSLLEIGIDYSCELCGVKDEWNSLKLTLEIDHKNGNNLDNRKENLRFLCPNCHSQTSTFRSKNVKKSIALMTEQVDDSDLKSEAATAA
jgi:predicted RNA-binding Zn-ribbon protein involved in translation (DUF1610 family)